MGSNETNLNEPQNDHAGNAPSAEAPGTELSLASVPPGVYLGAVLVLAVALNLNILHNPFSMDDMRVIVENRSLSTPGTLLHSFADSPSRAVLMLSFGYNLWLGGLNPAGFHVINIAMHAMACGLVFFLVLHIATRSTDLVAGIMSPRLAAFLAAAFFACHPLNSQTVNYISARSSSMSTVFYLLTVICFIKYTSATRGHTGTFWYSLSILSFILGVASKETVITVPVMLLVYDLFYVSRFQTATFIRRLLWPHLPYLVIASIVLILQVFVLGMPQPARPVWTNLMTQSHVLLNYLQLAVLPVGLTVDHGVPEYTRLFEPTTLVTVFTICVVVALAAVLARKFPSLSFATFWYFVTLAPSSSVVALPVLMSEHRAYLPLSGLVMLVPMAVARVALTPALQKRRREVGVAFVLLLAAMSAATVARNRVWRADLLLWNDAVTKSPDSARAQVNLGTAFASRGYAEEAIEALERAIELDPASYDAYSQLGFALERSGRMEESLAAHVRAIELGPADPRTRLRYAMSLQAAGRLDEAVDMCRQAILLDPGMTEAYLALGGVYNAMGQADDAIRTLEQAAELYPKNLLVQANLREMHRTARVIRERKTTLTEMIGEGTDRPELYSELGLVYLAERNLDRAAESFRQALAVKPSFGPALVNLGNVCLEQGHVDEATELFLRAAQFDQFALQAYTGLFRAYMEADRGRDALRALDSLEKLAGRQFPDLRRLVSEQEQRLHDNT